MPVRISKNRVALENIPLNESKGADIASATTVNLDSATGNLVHLTGTTTVSAITLASGSERTVVFDGILTLTHHATTLILPGNANITTATGDRAIFRGDGSGNTRCISYIKADGTAVSSVITGTTTNDNAAAGKIGEYIESIVTATTTGATHDVPANVTSISLTPGDWDVFGMALAANAGATTWTLFRASISQTSATLGAESTMSAMFAIGAGGDPPTAPK